MCLKPGFFHVYNPRAQRSSYYKQSPTKHTCSRHEDSRYSTWRTAGLTCKYEEAKVRYTSGYVFLCTHLFVIFFNPHIYILWQKKKGEKKESFVLCASVFFRKIPATKLLPFQELSSVMGLNKESCLLHVKCSIHVRARACVCVCASMCVRVCAR